MSKVQSTSPKPKKLKLTDAERYKRFLDAANEVGASDVPKAFEAAFEKVVVSISSSQKRLREQSS